MTLVPKHLWATLSGQAPAWQSRHVLAAGDALLSGGHEESVHAFIQQTSAEPLLCVRLTLGCRGYINVQKSHSLPSVPPSPCQLMRPREHAQKAQEEEPSRAPGRTTEAGNRKLQPEHPRVESQGGAATSTHCSVRMYLKKGTPSSA